MDLGGIGFFNRSARRDSDHCSSSLECFFCGWRPFPASPFCRTSACRFLRTCALTAADCVSEHRGSARPSCCIVYMIQAPAEMCLIKTPCFVSSCKNLLSLIKVWRDFFHSPMIVRCVRVRKIVSAKRQSLRSTTSGLVGRVRFLTERRFRALLKIHIYTITSNNWSIDGLVLAKKFFYAQGQFYEVFLYDSKKAARTHVPDGFKCLKFVIEGQPASFAVISGANCWHHP